MVSMCIYLSHPVAVRAEGWVLSACVLDSRLEFLLGYGSLSLAYLCSDHTSVEFYHMSKID